MQIFLTPFMDFTYLRVTYLTFSMFAGINIIFLFP